MKPGSFQFGNDTTLVCEQIVVDSKHNISAWAIKLKRKDDRLGLRKILDDLEKRLKLEMIVPGFLHSKIITLEEAQFILPRADNPDNDAIVSLLIDVLGSRGATDQGVVSAKEHFGLGNVRTQPEKLSFQEENRRWLSEIIEDGPSQSSRKTILMCEARLTQENMVQLESSESLVELRERVYDIEHGSHAPDSSPNPIATQSHMHGFLGRYLRAAKEWGIERDKTGPGEGRLPAR